MLPGTAIRRRLHLRHLFVATGAICALCAVSGCGIPHIATTSTHTRKGPTPGVMRAPSGNRTSTAAPPWKGLPVQTRSHAGTPGDPVNVGFEGSRGAVLAAFRRIGWVHADPLSIRDDVRLARDAVQHKLYPAAPISNLYLFGRAQDLAVEKELGSVAQRDHARLWNAHRMDPVTHQELWIGDAARDVKIEVVLRHGVPAGTTHRIGPDIDAERHRIVSGMQHAGMAKGVLLEPGIGRTTRGRNAENDVFQTDGKAAVIILKH